MLLTKAKHQLKPKLILIHYLELVLGLTQIIARGIVVSMLSSSTTETKKLAAIVAKKLLNKKQSEPLVFGLVGDLGAGKTFFVRSFLGTLGVKEKVKSPTFVLVKEYEINKPKSINKKYTKAYHIDVYRLTNLKSLRHLDFDKILKEKNAIVLIEWADKIKKMLPKKTIWINFEHGSKENERMIKISNF